MSDLSLLEILVGSAAFMLGGFVKGVIGMALPVVALSVLTSILSVPDAVGLQAIPILAANFWQGADPSQVRPTLKRFWPLLLALIFGLAVGTGLLVRVQPHLLYGIVGSLIMLVIIVQFLAPDLSVTPRQELWASPATGFFAGLLGGLATMFGPVIGMYLAALRLPKNLFISSQGIAYFSAGLPLTLFLIFRGILDIRHLWLSVIACAPVFLGLFVGRRLRDRIDQARFRQVVLLGLLLIGLNLVRRAIW